MDPHGPAAWSTQTSNSDFFRLEYLVKGPSMCRYFSGRVAVDLTECFVAFGVCTACFVCNALFSFGDKYRTRDIAV